MYSFLPEGVIWGTPTNVMTLQALPVTISLPKLLPDATYVLVGGFGGLGIRLIRWLASRGARTIVTISRSGAKSAAAKTYIEEMHG